MGAIGWTPKARDDLEAAVARLATFPRSGRVVPEFDRADIRELIVQSYRVVYRVRGEDVDILTVHHGARLLRDRPQAIEDG